MSSAYAGWPPGTPPPESASVSGTRSGQEAAEVEELQRSLAEMNRNLQSLKAQQERQERDMERIKR